MKSGAGVWEDRGVFLTEVGKLGKTFSMVWTTFPNHLALNKTKYFRLQQYDEVCLLYFSLIALWVLFKYSLSGFWVLSEYLLNTLWVILNSSWRIWILKMKIMSSWTLFIGQTGAEKGIFPIRWPLHYPQSSMTSSMRGILIFWEKKTIILKENNWMSLREDKKKQRQVDLVVVTSCMVLLGKRTSFVCSVHSFY